MSSKTYPTLSLETELVEAGSRFVIGIDEVGRGAIAGPVAVGAALIDSQDARWREPWPAKLRDSKLLAEPVREEVYEPVKAWAAGSAVGMVSALDIDRLGIVESLARAASAAIAQLLEDQDLRAAIAKDGAIVLLDGSHNWLANKAHGLPVTTRVKADRDCVVVSAASVLAKVERDRIMIEAHSSHPSFGWDGNKGYASEGHIEALKQYGPTDWHRHTWLTKILAEQQQLPLE
jgi:ribonuclease HII